MVMLNRALFAAGLARDDIEVLRFSGDAVAAWNAGGLDAILMIDNVMDRDGDGVECLVEEAFGGDPDDPTDGRAASPTWSAGAGRFEVSYLQRNDGAFDYGVECSPDLEEWMPVDAIPSPSGDTGNVLPGTTRMVVGVPRGDGQMYFRVRVTRRE
jgi:hypothetical protein